MARTNAWMPCQRASVPTRVRHEDDALASHTTIHEVLARDGGRSEDEPRAVEQEILLRPQLRHHLRPCVERG
jgi:hypothetical protein